MASYFALLYQQIDYKIKYSNTLLKIAYQF